MSLRLRAAAISLCLAACCPPAAHKLSATPPPPAPDDGLDATLVAQHLATAIRFKTVSHEDPKQDDYSQLDGLRAFLEKTYPKTFATLAPETVNDHGLLLTWKGSDASLAPILLMAHQDVVPVEPGTETKWTHDPFGGEIADGFVWGRGAIDDKGSLIATLEAIERLLADGFAPARTVYFASGFDEEVGGNAGSSKIAELLRSRGVKLAWVMDEGGGVTTGVVAGVKRPVASINVGEKGYLSVELVAHAQGGHSSMPPPVTSIGLLADALDELDESPMPLHATKTFREAARALAPEMPFFRRLAIANWWLFRPMLLRAAASRPSGNALVRTTTAPTILEAGIKDNVLPSTARAVVNFRILQGDDEAKVLAHVKAAIDDDRITITPMQRTISQPSRESSVDGAGYRAARAAITRFFPDAAVVPGIVTGATDSRWFEPIATDVYRFVPRAMDASDLPRIHGTDERVSVDGLATSVRGYELILREGAGH